MTWPADGRDAPPRPPVRKGKRRVIPDYITRRLDAPSLEWGSLGSATLVPSEDTGRLEWTFAGTRDAYTELPLRQVASVKIYPETCRHAPSFPELSSNKVVEESAKYLREYYPEVDVPVDVLEPLLKNAQWEANHPLLLDPALGNRLATLTMVSPSSGRPWPMLAFATGEIGSLLNVSAFQDDPIKFNTFVACASKLRDFGTPILQINACDGEDAGAVAIRCRTIVDVSRIEPQQFFDLERHSPVTYHDIDRIEATECGLKSFVDLALSSAEDATSEIRVMVIDESGTLLLWTGSLTSRASVQKFRAPTALDRPTMSLNMPLRWIILDNQDEIYIANQTHVFRLDIHDSTIEPTVIFNLHEADGHLTSISKSVGGVVCFLTTNRIFWFSMQKQGPLIAVNHGREIDTSLQMVWLSFYEEPAICVYSSKDDHMTVFPMSWSSSPTGPALAWAKAPPFSFNRGYHSSSDKKHRVAGLQLFQHPALDPSSLAFDIFELTANLSLYRSQIGPPSQMDTTIADDLVKWGRPVWTLQDTWDNWDRNEFETNLTNRRESTTIDLRPIYEKLFYRSSTWDALSNPRSLQNRPSDPDDQMADIPRALFRTLRDTCLVKEPSGRNRFLSSVIDPEVLESSVELEPGASAKESTWTFNMLDALRGIGPPDLPLPDAIDDLGWSQYSALGGFKSPASDEEVRQRERESAERLAEDLVASLIVASTHNSRGQSGPKSSTEAVDIMGATDLMAKTSLSKHSPLEFSVLSPVLPLETEVYQEMQAIEALLATWELGGNPLASTFNELFPEESNDSSETLDRPSSVKLLKPLAGSQIPKVAAAPSSFSILPASGSKGPPVVVERRLPYLTQIFEPPNLPIVAASQPSGHFDLFDTQMDPVPSTQPAPGKFGAALKKSAAREKTKKRVGGF